jgi:hypothetical protein
VPKLIAIVAAGILALTATTAQASKGKKLDEYIAQTHVCQRALHTQETKYSGRKWRGDRYDHWRLHKWWKRKTEYCKLLHQLNRDPRLAIRYVFGSRAEEALRVSGCETGHTYWVGSQNGQYLGIFQMGTSERARFGHGPTALEQAFAAYAYFNDSGRDWSPWACKP